MGVDFRMVHPKAARSAGVDPHDGVNWSAMRLMLDLLDAVGVMDHDAGPIYAAKSSSGHDEVYASFGGAMPPDPDVLRWEGEQAARLQSVPITEDVKVPAVKFSSNDGWLVFPQEAATMARALRGLTPEQVQAVLEADEDELEAINDPAVDDPPDMPTAVQNVLRRSAHLADYFERASEYGGFRVF